MDDGQDIKNQFDGSGQDEGIERLLQERERLDRELKSRFSQLVTVMFTDIKGSTTFFETYGDIEGRLMVQKHNEMLFPIIIGHNGRVIKTIGDAIMAAFEDPAEAVRAAVEMQQRLSDYNRTMKEKKQQIHIRIGINTGEGLVEKADVYGDVVNVAARVESITEPDEILISAAVYDTVRTSDDILCRYARQTKIKGKEEPVDVYRVVWDEEAALEGVTRSAAGTGAAIRRRRGQQRRLEIDISREADMLRITASEKSDTGGTTIRPYEELRVSMPQIQQLCQEIVSLLNRANTRGKVSKDILNKLRDVGQQLFDNLLSARAKETVRSARVTDLVFYIEDSLVQIPWELLHDGDQFLCQKFNMGRLVKTRHQVYTIKQRVLARPLKMLIVSDPRGDLENASREGRLIREQLDANHNFISANQRSGQIPAGYITEKIRNFDMIHYAGHADYDADDPTNSGWLLDGGKFTAGDIMKLIGGRPMPSLIFSNACQSGQTDEWKLGAAYNQKIFGLANAFLLAGVQHYIGTFWEILDEPGAGFAVEFYKAMLEGATVGEAVRQARHFLIRQYGEDTIVWASYMLYGDPGYSYVDFADETAEAAAAESSGHDMGQAAQLRSAPSETVSFTAPPAAASGKKSLFIGAGAAAIIACLLMFFLFQKNARETSSDPWQQAYAQLHAGRTDDARRAFEALPSDDPRHFEGRSAVYFELGDYKNALEMCARAQQLAPGTMYAAVIKGNLLRAQGKLDDALKEYGAAAEGKPQAPWQKAEALNGMARIYSAKGDTAQAAKLYGMAVDLNPASSEILVNRAMAMNRMGDAPGARGQLEKAVQANAADSFAAVMLADARRRQLAEDDKARQERIDKLVDDLAASFKAGATRKDTADDWSARPLTLSFVGLAAKGAPSEREGEDDFFMLKLTALLQDSGRVQILEREMIDKLLAELKLSSTELVNPDTALKLGRVMAARVIATGTVIRYNQDIQFSLRLTDTETTVLKAAITESAKDIDMLAQNVVKKILEKLKAGYPIRGTVQTAAGGQIMLNVGAAAGVQSGMEFRVFEELPADRNTRPAYRPAGTLTIAAVSPDSATASIAQPPDGGIKPGYRVEQIVR
ncbi:MAG: CHAT domain-containing protein [Proteobacteria bacterium]|nr:CHAT domain-containing protein [Pseudomonadota bacterium]